MAHVHPRISASPAAAHLHKSELLFRRFGSTVPGLGQIGDGCARNSWRVRRPEAAFRHFPDRAKDVEARRSAPFLVPDQLQDRSLQIVEARIGIAPWVAQ